jgi:hypothetical protein
MRDKGVVLNKTEQLDLSDIIEKLLYLEFAECDTKVWEDADWWSEADTGVPGEGVLVFEGCIGEVAVGLVSV